MKTFFIADTHFSDKCILKYENRPFKNAREMDVDITDRWNIVVGEKDVVYHLGDFGANKNLWGYLNSLNGIKILIKGNHDTESNYTYRTSGFDEVYDHPIILDGFWMLSHEPLYVSSNMPYANIFGHVHNSPFIKDFSSHHFCVSVERINYTPIDFDTIKRKIKEASLDE